MDNHFHLLVRTPQSKAEAFALKAADLRRHGLAAARGKAVAVELARQLSGKTRRAIGVHYGEITSHAVSKLCSKARKTGEAGV